DAALDAGVERALFIGTDKAVNPSTSIGATKVCAEKLFVESNAYSRVSGTRFSSVRYSNVVGSRGRVFPIFLRQAIVGLLDGRYLRTTRSPARTSATRCRPTSSGTSFGRPDVTDAVLP